MNIHNRLNNLYFYVGQLSSYVKYNLLTDEKFWNVEISYNMQVFNQFLYLATLPETTSR